MAYPRIYVEGGGCTIEWLEDRYSMKTVAEFNRWLGLPDLPDRAPDLEITRCVILLETNHEEILKLQEELHAGTTAVAQCIEICRQLNGVLGWDFRRQEPRISVYPCSDDRRSLSPLTERQEQKC